MKSTEIRTGETYVHATDFNVTYDGPTNVVRVTEVGAAYYVAGKSGRDVRRANGVRCDFLDPRTGEVAFTEVVHPRSIRRPVNA